MDETLPPGTRLGPYEIEGLVGSGGMGQVYRALDPRLGRRVAVKTLPSSLGDDPVLARRFESEARTAGGLDHPNLLVVYDVGRAGDVPFIVSELLEGETLRERLRREGALPARAAWELARQIAAGLAAAHARGIVHRDLKPENVFLTRDRRVKILDFGIAKRVAVPGADGSATGAGGAGAAGERLTATGVIVGTMGYMAPEQLLGDGVDARADVFALGVVLHELLAGRAPFWRESSFASMSAAVSDDPPPLPASVPAGLARLVARCLAKAPDDRFQSAHDVGLALELVEGDERPTTGGAGVAASGAPDAARGAVRGDSSGGRVSRRAVLGYGAAGALLAAAGFAGGRASDGPAPVAGFRRLTFRRGLIRSARVAPDGQTILFGALWDGGACRVHTARFDGPESSALELPDANLLAVSRAGELAVALGPHRDGTITYGTLARVPLSGGAPRELLEGVKFADWSPDGSSLAAVRLVDGVDTLEYPLGTPLVRPRPGEASGLGFARVSADGKQVAFVQYRTPASLTGRVCVVDASGRVTPLTHEYLSIHGLAWRGDEVWFTAGDERPLFRALLAVTPRGQVRTVARAPGNLTLWDALPDGRPVLAQTDDRAVLVVRGPGDVVDRDLSWLDASWVATLSRDGRQILFSEAGQGGGPDAAAYLRPTDGGPAVRLASGLAYALSPDGRWALCAPTYGGATGGVPYLTLVPTGAGASRRLTSPGLTFIAARWLPDGDHLVALGSVPGARARLYRVALADGRAEPLGAEGAMSWAVAPDGDAVAVRGVGPGITIVPLAGGTGGTGGTPRAVPGTTEDDRPIGWVRGGLLLRRPNDPARAPGAVELTDPATGQRTPWANILPQDAAGIMSLARFDVTPDGAHRACSWHRATSDLYLAEGLG